MDGEQPEGHFVINFKTHEAAQDALVQIGFRDSRKAAAFTPEQLKQRVEELVGAAGWVVLDVSETVPCTPVAAYQALTCAAFEAAASSRKGGQTAFLLMRTAENTPSFLMGVHWQAAQAEGLAVGQAPSAPTSTPALFLFLGEDVIEAPSQFFDLPLRLAAAVVADQIDSAGRLECGICGEPLVTREGRLLRFGEIAALPDGRVFRKGCVMSALDNDDVSFATCKE